MSVLSVDLACRSWADLGVVLLEQKGPGITCEILRWNDPWAPPVVELALRLNQVCRERGAGVLMLDGPQAWKSDDNGQQFSRVSERELNTPAKMGLPGNVLPGTYERFVGYCLALYDALGIKPLPSKRKCRVSDLAEAWASLTSLLPIAASQPPNHDQMQAIVGGLPGLAFEERGEGVRRGEVAGSRIVGRPPSWEGGYWREGFIVVPVSPNASAVVGQPRWVNPSDT